MVTAVGDWSALLGRVLARTGGTAPTDRPAPPAARAQRAGTGGDGSTRIHIPMRRDLDNYPDDIPAEDPPNGPAATVPEPGPGDQPVPTAELVADVPGVVVLDMSAVAPTGPHVIRVGAGPLPQWCATRPRGVRWECGWWTDAGALPAKATAAPAGTPAAPCALPTEAAGRWAQLVGQDVDDWSWMLALDLAGEVLGAFHTPISRRARLLADLGAGEAGTPTEPDWALTRGQSPPTTNTSSLENAA